METISYRSQTLHSTMLLVSRRRRPTTTTQSLQTLSSSLATLRAVLLPNFLSSNGFPASESQSHPLLPRRHNRHDGAVLELPPPRPSTKKRANLFVLSHSQISCINSPCCLSQRRTFHVYAFSKRLQTHQSSNGLQPEHVLLPIFLFCRLFRHLELSFRAPIVKHAGHISPRLGHVLRLRRYNGRLEILRLYLFKPLVKRRPKNARHVKGPRFVIKHSTQIGRRA